MTLVQLFLVYRYGAGSLHYLTPTEADRSQTEQMQDLGIFTVVRTEIGPIIVPDVNPQRVSELVWLDGEELAALIREPMSQMAQRLGGTCVSTAFEKRPGAITPAGIGTSTRSSGRPLLPRRIWNSAAVSRSAVPMALNSSADLGYASN